MRERSTESPSTTDELAARWADLLQRPVRTCCRAESRSADDLRAGSISADAPAYEAGLMMREHGLSRLAVHDAETQQVIGYVSKDALREVLSVLDVAPYLGEAMVARLLQPVAEPAQPALS